jgi:hypothetical protein
MFVGGLTTDRLTRICGGKILPKNWIHAKARGGRSRVRCTHVRRTWGDTKYPYPVPPVPCFHAKMILERQRVQQLLGNWRRLSHDRLPERWRVSSAVG